MLAFLFFIALLAINPKDDGGKIDPKLEFLVTVSWPDRHPDDIDLFVQDPLGNMVWYRRREAGFMVLDRDDRGGANDFIMVNGQKVPSPIRQEIVSIRGVVSGEYTVNVYHFAALNRTTGARHGEGREAQSDRAGGVLRHAAARSWRARSHGRALRDRRRRQSARDQSQTTSRWCRRCASRATRDRTR